MLGLGDVPFREGDRHIGQHVDAGSATLRRSSPPCADHDPCTWRRRDEHSDGPGSPARSRPCAAVTVSCASSRRRTPVTTLNDQLPLNRRRPRDRPDRIDRRVVPGLVLVLAAVAGWRDGGFWHAEALAVALIAGVLLVAALVAAPPDRRSGYVIGSLGLLAVWWYIRSVTAGTGTDFLPLGASIIAFAAAFAAVRPLPARGREVAALAMASLGAVGALVGFAGLIWRWFPVAMPAQGLWRLSSSLTYADAAGLVCGVCLLLALGCARAPAFVRVVVCLNLAGVLATQSRGALLAVVCGAFLVPARRYRELAVPLVAGLALGVAAIGSSPERNPVLWLAPVLVLAVVLAAVAGRWRPGRVVDSTRPDVRGRRCSRCRHRRRPSDPSRGRPPGPGPERSGPVGRMVERSAPMDLGPAHRSRT